jgi:hypothetical protein
MKRVVFVLLMGCTSLLGVDFEERPRADGGVNDASGSSKVDRAWSMWSIDPTSPLNVSRENGLAFDSFTELYWEAVPSTFEFFHAGALAHCEALVLDGFSDFRLPTRIELASIVRYVALGVKLDTAMDGKPSPYATVSSDARAPSSYWAVDFGTGVVAPLSDSQAFDVRCVRGGKDIANTPDVRFVPASDGTVFDKITGLVWLAAPVGPFSDKDARIHCQTLASPGTGRFRVPSLHELNTLIDDSRSTPALAPPFSSKGTEWISNLVGSGSTDVYAIDTQVGSSNTLPPDGQLFFTRCVR